VNTSLKGISPFYQRLSPQNYWKLFRILFLEKNLANRERIILEMTTQSKGFDPDLVKKFVDIQLEHPVKLKTVLAQLFAGIRFTPPKEAPKVKTILLGSLGDQLVHPQCSISLSKKWDIPLEQNAWAGHDLPLEDPQWVLEKIEKYFSMTSQSIQRQIKKS
jgi:hypothetical protein